MDARDSDNRSADEIDDISVVDSDGVVRIRLDNQASSNRLTSDSLIGLSSRFERLLQTPDALRVVILEGIGPDFSLGRADDGAGIPFEAIYAITAALRDRRIISVAAPHGRAFGLGFGLILQCDIVVAADDSVFAFDEVTNGIPPTIVLSYLGDLVGQRRALQLVATACEIDARSALHLGIVHEVVARTEQAGRMQDLVYNRLQPKLELVSWCKGYMKKARHIAWDLRPEFAELAFKDWMSG